jgi:glutaminase
MVRFTPPGTPIIGSRYRASPKPFIFALVCQAIGAELACERIRVNSTGLPFNCKR